VANVNLNVLSNVNSDRNNSAVFTDLTLDVIINKTYSNQLYKTQQIIDIQSDNNLGAIYNSISNLITTSPGQKPLNPLFGISFRDLLFLPVSEDRGRLIGTTISENIQKFEPRVNINNINIIPDEEQQQYVIELNISVPRFNVQQTKIVGVLDKAGFYYNNN
jgi:phage baseplate assembly protein W